MLEAVSLNAARGDRPIFIGLNLRVAAGQALHVTGVNGSGKSTLLRILAGLLCPESGHLCWHGRKMESGRALPHAAYLGHRNGLKAELTALENLRSIATLYGYASAQHALLAALDQVGMAAAAAIPVGLLSQGQQRRIALARVVSSAAPLWLLDEPSTALDQASIQLFEQLCAQHLHAGGMLVFANHQPLQLPSSMLHTLALPTLAPRRTEEAACWRPLAI